MSSGTPIMQDQNALTLGIDHLGLTVSDLELTRRFFVDCLGWKVVGENPAYPAVFVADGHSRLTLWQSDKSDGCAAFDRRKNVGLHHVALKVADLATLDTLYARVSQWPGVVVEFAQERVGSGPRIHCMVREPSGLRLEFVYTPTA
jgi:catechol 2,3-dioxygenase-like lactoylglutathione lyase family enzyme